VKSFRKIFVDGNIILDYFTQDRPFSKYSEIVIDYFIFQNPDVSLITSCDLITTIYYVLSKKNKEEALFNIKDALDFLKLVSFSNQEVNQAIKLMLTDKNFKDLEDTIQYVLAKENGCDLILTNDKDFYSPDIEILSSKEFIEKYIK
jgi:predicted nucleic acid-binding protein